MFSIKFFFLSVAILFLCFLSAWLAFFFSLAFAQRVYLKTKLLFIILWFNEVYLCLVFVSLEMHTTTMPIVASFFG